MSETNIIKQYQFALIVPLIFSLLLEFIYWVVWGIMLFPGHTWEKFRWALSCGLGMGSVVGVITCLFIVEKLSNKQAIFASFSLVLLVGSLCTINCFLMDQQANLWGAVSHPNLFLIAGLVGTLIGAILYSWLLFTETGSQLIESLLSRKLLTN
jgi:hypothetical protein